MAIAIDSGSATIATVRPANTSARKSATAVALAPDGDELWQIEFGKGRPTKLVQLACVFACDAHVANAPLPTTLRCIVRPRHRARRCVSSDLLPSMIIAGSRPHPTRRPRLLEPNATSAAFAARLFADQLDAGPIEGFDHLHQGLDHAANVAGARLHPLDGRQRNARKLGQGLWSMPSSARAARIWNDVITLASRMRDYK